MGVSGLGCLSPSAWGSLGECVGELVRLCDDSTTVPWRGVVGAESCGPRSSGSHSHLRKSHFPLLHLMNVLFLFMLFSDSIPTRTIFPQWQVVGVSSGVRG
jgi:hypothetical protein